MPKFLLGTVTVRTHEVWAASVEEAESSVLLWQQGETEEPEGGVKVTRYKLGWKENQTQDDVTHDRNLVLAAFLDLMGKIPGMPEQDATPEKRLIINPFDRPSD